MRTILQHHEKPEDFDFYVRHNFDKGMFVSIYRIKATPLPDQPFRIGAPVLQTQRAWVEFGIDRGSRDPLVEALGSYKEEDIAAAWLDFSELAADIIRKKVAIMPATDGVTDEDIYAELVYY